MTITRHYHILNNETFEVRFSGVFDGPTDDLTLALIDNYGYSIQHGATDIAIKDETGRIVSIMRPCADPDNHYLTDGSWHAAPQN